MDVPPLTITRSLPIESSKDSNRRGMRGQELGPTGAISQIATASFCWTRTYPEADRCVGPSPGSVTGARPSLQCVGFQILTAGRDAKGAVIKKGGGAIWVCHYGEPGSHSQDDFRELGNQAMRPYPNVRAALITSSRSSRMIA